MRAIKESPRFWGLKTIVFQEWDQFKPNVIKNSSYFNSLYNIFLKILAPVLLLLCSGGVSFNFMAVNVPNPRPVIPTIIPTTTGSDRVERARDENREIVRQTEADNQNILSKGLDQFVRAAQTRRTVDTAHAQKNQEARANTEAQLDRFIPPEVHHQEPVVPTQTNVTPDVPTQQQTAQSQSSPDGFVPQAPTTEQAGNGQSQQNSGDTGGRGSQTSQANPQIVSREPAVAIPRSAINTQPSRTVATTTSGSSEAQPEGTPRRTLAQLAAGLPETIALRRVTAQATASRAPTSQPLATMSLPTPQAGQVPGQVAQEAPARGIQIYCYGTAPQGEATPEAQVHQQLQAGLFRSLHAGHGSTTLSSPATQVHGAVVVAAAQQGARLSDIMKGDRTRGNPNVARDRGSRNRVTEVTARDVALGVQKDRSSIPA